MSKSDERAYNLKIGQSIKTLRLQHGQSQQQLAAKLGLTFQQVQKYEKGSNLISAGKLVIIANHFDVPLGRFVDAVDLPGPAERAGAHRREGARLSLEISRAIRGVKSAKILRAILHLVRSVSAIEAEDGGAAGADARAA